MESIVIILGVMLLVVGLLIYTSLSWGFVVLKMWQWFILPVFTQLPQITYWQAVGLVFFIGLFQSQITAGAYIKDDWEYKDKTGALTTSLITPWITILVAYLIKELFM